MNLAMPVPDFSRLLRDCRRGRRLSQLELALQAEVSQRHLSFLESGRARPSRDMVAQLAEALDLPLRERNRLLQAAGYAPLYPQRPLDAGDMGPARQALELLLRHQEPYPAIVVDRAWNLVMANDAVSRVFSMVGDLDRYYALTCGDGPRNVLKLIFHPEGLRPHIANLAEIGPALLARTAREGLAHPEVQAVLDEVFAYPGLPARWRAQEVHPLPLPVLPLRFSVGGVSLNLFSMLSTFGTPQDVTTDELRVESFFPADSASESLLRQLAAAAT